MTSTHVFAIAAVVLAAACGHDDPVASAPAPNAPDTQAADAAIAQDTTPAPIALPSLDGGPEPVVSYVHITGEWVAEGQKLRVRVWIGRFDELFGIAGHLRYDPDALELLTLEPHHVPQGPSASADWEAVSLAEDTPKGRILMGGARFRLKPSIYDPMLGVKVEREPWLVAEFKVKKVGTTSLHFDPATITARTAKGVDLAVTANPGVVTVPALPLAGGAK